MCSHWSIFNTEVQLLLKSQVHILLALKLRCPMVKFCSHSLQLMSILVLLAVLFTCDLMLVIRLHLLFPHVGSRTMYSAVSTVYQSNLNFVLQSPRSALASGLCTCPIKHNPPPVSRSRYLADRLPLARALTIYFHRLQA